MMATIYRGEGVTESEKHLAKLGDRTFLNLWAYPNTFIDKKEATEGKELCDLLVVCGKDILIFSDKAIDWPQVEDVNLAWSRWYRRAVEGSAKQIHGAERWIKQFPNRIFVDRKCEQRLPVELPKSDVQKIHGIVVANGAEEACKKYFGAGAGTLLINPNIENEHHYDVSKKDIMPFAIGDISSNKSFIHVFDSVGLDLVMYELDTIADFTTYLNKRAEIIRSKRLVIAPGEEELLALYLQTEDENGAHGFRPEGGEWKEGECFGVAVGVAQQLLMRPEYHAKKRADKISYTWDKLIEIFTEHVLAGTSVDIIGIAPSAGLAERALRIMALENRFSRRILSENFMGAMRFAENKNARRFTRIICSEDRIDREKVAYVILIMAYSDEIDEGSYDNFRKERIAILHGYCMNVFEKFNDIDFAVGIAVDIPSAATGRRGGSEDLLAIPKEFMTEEMAALAKKFREEVGILDEKSMIERRYSAQEYPSVSRSVPDEPLSRQRRRAEERRARKALRKNKRKR
jgi:hypothetical protein